MFFTNNLQLLRKMRANMSQEALADKMDVSRQTVSKWESGAAYPEVDKLIALSEFFHCTLDQLLKEDMARRSDAYSPVKLVLVDRFRMAQYAVISAEPEDDTCPASATPPSSASAPPRSWPPSAPPPTARRS